MASEDCSICCETFNLQNHKKVTCPFCDFDICRKCTQTYLVNTVNDPHCMKCKNAWNREFIDKSCTKVFRNKDLKNHRENVLLEREKSFLPETQPAARRRKQARELAKRIQEVRDEISNQRNLLFELENSLRVLNEGHDITPGQVKAAFIRKCPLENCKGFLSQQWKCETCEKKICSKCNELKADDHECDPENVKTMELLKKDTKPCPKCGTMINKSSGCSQMWCPSCHCAFNWNTGNIETGVIHNPHFYEFQRRNAGSNTNAARNPGDIPCGGMPTIPELNTLFDKKTLARRPTYGRYYEYPNRLLIPKKEELSPEQLIVYEAHRLVGHIEDYELRYNYNEYRVNNQDLRIKYLLNELNDENFKKTIQQREKKCDKTRDISNILRMFSITSTDMLRQLVVSELGLKEFCENIENLRNYTNEQLKIISKRYSSKNIIITKGWEVI
jgi:hypothetical protein